MLDSEVQSDFNSCVKIPSFQGKWGGDNTIQCHPVRAACRIKGFWNVVASMLEQ